MPLYEYECTQCQRHTEKIQKFSDPEIVVCPHCGGVLKRVISAAAVRFTGGGWFKDGYGSKRSVGTGESSSASGSTAGESKSESAAPAAAAAPAPAPSTDKK
jgi:putative FmdB family regulatory protein